MLTMTAYGTLFAFSYFDSYSMNLTRRSVWKFGERETIESFIVKNLDFNSKRNKHVL